MRLATLLASATALSVLLSGVARAEDVTISYWMWDGNQSPEYQKCADKFQAANPGIKIDIKQEGWDNYWTNLTTGFVSGTAPDVFVNHLSRFPEFLSNDVMVNITDRIAADKTDMKGYIPGLAESWNKDGQQYGLPKDWDTVALVYNKAMTKAAGVTDEEMMNLDWNPKDGGSFGKVLAKLSVDAAGKHGNEEGFDKSNIATYGMVSNRKGDYGQTEWSWLAVSNGFKYIDKSWGSKFSYDDPKLAEAMDWFRGEVAAGHHVSQEEAGKIGGSSLFFAGKGAISPDGSWMIRGYKDGSKFDIGFAPVPKGPEGRRSMFNGLADSIWTGSKHPDEAWKWVQYLGTSECQTMVGNAAVVFPARPEAVEAAVAAHKANGLDVTAFKMLATPETTFPFPIADHGNEVSSILNAAMDKVMLGDGATAEVLKTANDEVNALFQ
jgi:multiple sugar transport system substrate-binding protein